MVREMLPGMYWLSDVTKDNIKANNIQLIVSDRHCKDVKHILKTEARPSSITSINDICDALLTLYKRGIIVGIYVPSFEAPTLIIAWMMLKLKMTSDMSEINDLLLVNYGLDLSDSEVDRIYNASRYTDLL